MDGVGPAGCHDGHDSGVSTSDAWLRQKVGAITA